MMFSVASMALGLCSVLPLASANILPNIIYRDVVVIGGGASGAYAAVRMRDDFGKSIALIEKQENLGGMVNTYVSDSGATFDYGVQTFLNKSKAADFFARFNIPVGSGSRSLSLTTEYIDFNTGASVSFTPPTFDKQIAAIAKFFEIIAPWESMLSPGYWDFPEPSDIPEDLLIPFGEFLTNMG